MRDYAILLSTLIIFSCSAKNKNQPTLGLEAKADPKSSIILSENKLGDLDLNGLNEFNIQSKTSSAFPNFQIKKTVGQQDGPNFNLYQISDSMKEIFFIRMDSYDSTMVRDLWTMNKMIMDQYGVTVGQPIESVVNQRPKLTFHSDLHYNIYATQMNSKIEYKLSGNIKDFNEHDPASDDFSLEASQVKEMKVEYLVWRK